MLAHQKFAKEYTDLFLVKYKKVNICISILQNHLLVIFINVFSNFLDIIIILSIFINNIVNIF